MSVAHRRCTSKHIIQSEGSAAMHEHCRSHSSAPRKALIKSPTHFFDKVEDGVTIEEVSIAHQTESEISEMQFQEENEKHFNTFDQMEDLDLHMELQENA
ncbi:hypothetical protein COOONC_27989 [Cooperia oncophora]